MNLRAVVRVLAAVSITVVALLPVLAPHRFPLTSPASGARLLLGFYAALLLPAGALFLGWKLCARRLALLALCCVLSGLLTYVHLVVVDRGAYFPQMTNLEWQLEVNEAAVQRDPGAIPHGYRFGPDSLVRLLSWLSGSFVFARTLYRFSFGLLLLALIHRFARNFLPTDRAVLVVLLYCVVYPVTIFAYAGQLADPASHLSFVAAFVALHSGAFVEFVLAISIGALAKESVVAMVGYHALFRRREDPAYWRHLLAAGAIGAITVAAARWEVIRLGFGYDRVSGVGVEHIANNLGAWRLWLPQLVFSMGIFLPFVVLGWSRAHPTLKRLTLYLVPVLGLSNLVFSWIHEVRNLVPVLIPMAIITVGYLWPEREPGARQPAGPHSRPSI